MKKYIKKIRDSISLKFLIIKVINDELSDFNKNFVKEMKRQMKEELSSFLCKFLGFLERLSAGLNGVDLVISLCYNLFKKLSDNQDLTKEISQ